MVNAHTAVEGWEGEACTKFMMSSERPLDEGTECCEWVVGRSIQSVDSWAVAPSTESVDFSLSLVTKNVLVSIS